MKKTSLFLLAVAAMATGCKKDEEKELQKATVSIYMTDAPAVYDAVNIDVQGVSVTGPSAGEVNLSVNAGIYNLLDLANGVDTLLATGSIDAGLVSQIRLILGPDNSVVIDSVNYPLATPSAMQSGLKLQVHKTFEPGVTYMLLLDFDAGQSIVNLGNGSYVLKPVINVVDSALSGAITGSIDPVTSCSVIAVNGADTTSTYCAPDGRFLIQGLAAGSYDVTVTPSAPYIPVTISNVAVTTGSTTDLGTISL